MKSLLNEEGTPTPPGKAGIISQFIAITFGCSILVGLVLTLAGIPLTSPIAVGLLAFFMMPSPALATCVVHRFRWKEMTERYGLNFRRLHLLLIIRATVTFLLSYLVLYFLLVFALGNLLDLPGVGHLTFSSSVVSQEIARSSGAKIPSSPPLVPLLFMVGPPAAILAGFSINGLFAFGEELGWRGFLWNQLRGWGFKGKILLGIIWGLWHAPIILLGLNFPAHPYLGILFMVLLTVSLTFPFTYLRDRLQTVYAPAIAHGMFNASGFVSLLVIGKSELIGNFVGLVGCIAILLAWWMTVLTLALRESGQHRDAGDHAA